MGHHSWPSHFGRHDRDPRDFWNRHGGGDSRKSRSRMFEQGDLRFVVLKLLADKPAHGYEIIKAVEQRFGGAYAPSPGIVYPTLTLLEEQGFIEIVESVGSRKLYGLTDLGRSELARCSLDVERVFARMQDYRQRYGGGPAPRFCVPWKICRRPCVCVSTGARLTTSSRSPRFSTAPHARSKSCDDNLAAGPGVAVSCARHMCPIRLTRKSRAPYSCDGEAGR